MSIKIKVIIEAVLKFIAWSVFKDTYKQARKARIDRINLEYIDKIKEELYKDE